jgi:ribosomal protein S18 acetylase RimI-like enzyme
VSTLLCTVPPETVRKAHSPLRKLFFRPAAPADVDAVVPLIYSSASAAFDFLFAVPGRGSPRKFLRRAFVDGTGQFGFRNHMVGVEDGVVVAVGAAWSGASRFAFILAGARQIVACYRGIGAVLGVVEHVARTEEVIVPPAQGELYIGHLGVCPERRGGGIGSALITRLIAQNRHSALDKAVLDVALSNPRGQQLYQRLGFAVTAERRSRLVNAQGVVVDHRRMEMPM